MVVIAATGRLAFLAAVVVLAVACSSSGSEPAETGRRPQEPRTSATTLGGTLSTVGATVGTGGPGLPIHVELSADRLPLRVDQPFGVTLSLVTDIALGNARGTFTASGAIKLVEASVADWRAVVAGGRVFRTATLRLSGMGPGEVRGSVEVLGVDGVVKFASAAAIEVLVTPTEVLTGTNGPLVLELEHLDRERAAGRISDEQRRQRREQILGAGALPSG